MGLKSKIEEIIISYDYGYNDWYVTEFYKFFHKKLNEILNVNIKFVPLKDLAKNMGKEFNDHSDSLFTWFNLIIMNTKTGKMFVHSWYDYAFTTYLYCEKNNYNVVKFSACSSITNEFIENHRNVQPSIYYLENWSDQNLIKFNPKGSKKNNCYFAGWSHGNRENILNEFKKYDFFEIFLKGGDKPNKTKKVYYEDLSNYKFGLSLDGAAGICYRDIELFASGSLNLRQPIKINTYSPIIEGVHYVNFVNEDLISSIIKGYNVESVIKENIEKIIDFSSTSEYGLIINNAREWFEKNCLPDNQFKILYSFLDELEILF